mgnify:CR=1 FL=1|jgi:hypothetical protein|tara:strand:+ start:786 stop:1592 length:807 start_codon:yes stop_codon:yes gene_type:complete
MAKPTTRGELIDYCLRQLGAPILEINVAEEQTDDLLDDALQYFQERHFDGVEKMYLKYQITQSDIDRARSNTETNRTVGITTYTFQEGNNYIEIPDSVIGIEKIFKFDSNTISGNMFSIKYQLFLNDMYQFNSVDLLNYVMTKSYLEDIDHILTPDVQIRFNKRQNRLYLDIDWETQTPDTYIVIECFRILDPSNNAAVYNDSFLKKYLTALIKKQWGQNLIKFKGVRLPGGIEFNGREIYEDGQRDLDEIIQKMSTDYELPPFDMIG